MNEREISICARLIAHLTALELSIEGLDRAWTEALSVPKLSDLLASRHNFRYVDRKKPLDQAKSLREELIQIFLSGAFQSEKTKS